MIAQPEILELERIHALEPRPPETSTETLLRWSQDDLFSVRRENLFLRSNIKEEATDKKEIWFSRNHWRLAAAIGWGIAIIALVLK